MAGESQTVSEYIIHHLTNLTYGKLPAGYERLDYDGNLVSVVPEGGMWTFAHGGAEASAMGFMAIHVDSMIWSIGLGIVFCWLFRSAAKKASAKKATIAKSSKQQATGKTPTKSAATKKAAVKKASTAAGTKKAVATKDTSTKAKGKTSTKNTARTGKAAASKAATKAKTEAA